MAYSDSATTTCPPASLEPTTTHHWTVSHIEDDILADDMSEEEMEFSFRDMVKVDWATDGESPVLTEAEPSEPLLAQSLLAQLEPPVDSGLHEIKSGSPESLPSDSGCSVPVVCVSAADAVEPKATLDEEESLESSSGDLYSSAFLSDGREDIETNESDADTVMEDSGIMSESGLAVGPQRACADSWDYSEMEVAIALAAHRAQQSATPEINPAANAAPDTTPQKPTLLLTGRSDLGSQVSVPFLPYFKIHTLSSQPRSETPDLVLHATDFSSLFQAVMTGSLVDQADIAPGKFLVVVAHKKDVDSVRRMLQYSQVEYIAGGQNGLWTMDEVSRWGRRDILRLFGKYGATPVKRSWFNGEFWNYARWYKVGMLSFVIALIIGCMAGVYLCAMQPTSTTPHVQQPAERLQQETVPSVTVAMTSVSSLPTPTEIPGITASPTPSLLIPTTGLEPETHTDAAELITETSIVKAVTYAVDPTVFTHTREEVVLINSRPRRVRYWIEDELRTTDDVFASIVAFVEQETFNGKPDDANEGEEKLGSNMTAVPTEASQTKTAKATTSVSASSITAFQIAARQVYQDLYASALNRWHRGMAIFKARLSDLLVAARERIKLYLPLRRLAAANAGPAPAP
ncbi:hypothetical protein DFJ77DRAFT_452081 [Powellomyces hirtus]|nr:hypothetical protein DFJ77DRAFT_452081 [Powellomyces hirtus]